MIHAMSSSAYRHTQASIGMYYYADREEDEDEQDRANETNQTAPVQPSSPAPTTNTPTNYSAPNQRPETRETSGTISPYLDRLQRSANVVAASPITSARRCDVMDGNCYQLNNCCLQPNTDGTRHRFAGFITHVLTALAAIISHAYNKKNPGQSWDPDSQIQNNGTISWPSCSRRGNRKYRINPQQPAGKSSGWETVHYLRAL